MPQPVDHGAVERRAHEVMSLLKQEIQGQPVSDDVQRRLNYLAACGDKVGTPWSEIAKEMRAEYLKNEQLFHSGRSYDKWLPSVIITDSKVITARPDYMPGRNLAELLFQPSTEGKVHTIDTSATVYRPDQCVRLEGEPGSDRFTRFPEDLRPGSKPRSRSLAPRG